MKSSTFSTGSIFFRREPEKPGDIGRFRLPLIGNHKLNVYLKTIRDICGIDKPIFSHVARHIYATRCLLTARHYLTQVPDPDASRELPDLVNGIAKTNKDSFIGAFDKWYERNKDIVNERVHDKRIKKKTPPYMRPRLRSAYLSIKRNMPQLWTFYDNPNIGLPNTNNGLKGIFSDIKTKLRVHSGLTREHGTRRHDINHTDWFPAILNEAYLSLSKKH